MKDSKITELLKELGSLTLNDAPKEQILTKAVEIKAYLQDVWYELGRATNLVDSTVNAFVPDEKWEIGLPTERIKVPAPSLSTTSPSKPRATLVTTASLEHILEIARKVSADGIVETKYIIAQLKSEGDTRPDSDIAKSVGNTLARNGWERVGTGKYKLREEQKVTKDILSGTYKG